MADGSSSRARPGWRRAHRVLVSAVAGGKAGAAYVGWLSDNSPRGFAQYLRPFSIRRGWLSAPIRVSREFGKRTRWPGDTIGISLLSRAAGQPRIMLSWGSAVSGRASQIWAAQVRRP